jgi:arylsulfatase A-like enzyme
MGPSESDRPNILFFFTDDQRFDTIAALGNEHIHTPNIDRLVHGGTTFTHAHIMGGSCPAVCMPSRAMLHSGRTLFHIQDQGQEVPADHALLGETLRAAGYTTFGTGKWHNGKAAFNRSFTHGAEIMFGGMADHWNVPVYDYDPSGQYATMLPIVDEPGGSNKVRYRPCDHIHSGKHSSELLADATIDFLRQHEDGPFFAYLSFLAPHDPRTMPQEFLDMYDPEQVPLPKNFLGGHPFDNGELHIRDEMLAGFPRTPLEIRRHIAEYYAMITHLDAQLGRVVAVLEEKGELENTIIVFAGDNGLAVGQHGLLGKQNLYEHSVRVPLIFSGPGVPKGERRDACAYLLDIFPTLCGLVDTPVPDSVEGVSLAPAMADPNEKVRDTLLCAYRHIQRSARDRRYKLIEYVVDGRRTTQLFDLETDPLEMHNLADDPAHADPVARLRTELVRWRDEFGDTRDDMGPPFWEGY